MTIGPDDVIVTQTPRAGWAVATEAGETVAIDITVSPELRQEGLAREVIRLVQEARKNDGLEVTDRIWLRWSTGDDPNMVMALTEHAGLIAGEVLAVDYGPGGRVDRPRAAWEHAEDGSRPDVLARARAWSEGQTLTNRGSVPAGRAGRRGTGCSPPGGPRPVSSGPGRPDP